MCNAPNEWIFEVIFLLRLVKLTNTQKLESKESNEENRKSTARRWRDRDRHALSSSCSLDGVLGKRNLKIWVYLRVSFVRSSPSKLSNARSARKKITKKMRDRRADEISRKQIINLRRRRLLLYIICWSRFTRRPASLCSLCSRVH